MSNLTRACWTVVVLALTVASLAPFYVVTAAVGIDSPALPDTVPVLAILVACYAAFFALSTAEGRASVRTGEPA